MRVCVGQDSLRTATTERVEKGETPRSGQELVSSAPSAEEMLLSPATSTPFSIDDILRQEREQNDSKTPSQWKLNRNPEKLRYLRMAPGSMGSESSGRAHGGGSNPLRCLWETVLDKDSNPGREPRKYALRSFLQALFEKVGRHRERTHLSGSHPANPHFSSKDSLPVPRPAS